MKTYCELCDKQQPVRIDYMRKDSTYPHQGIWGDICCSVCFLVIITISDLPEEGIYDFVKVSELPVNGTTEKGQ